jgi:hypothetical protein
VRWLLKRNVFLKSIFLNSVTNPITVELYGRLPGVEVLVLDGCVDFLIDLAVRRAQTLHKLVLIRQGLQGYGHGRWHMQMLLMFIRRWRREGGVLKKLICTECQFYDISVDLGNCDSLTYVKITRCHSDRYTAAGVGQGYTRLMWNLVSKCTNLEGFEFTSREVNTVEFSDLDLSVLARFCLNLQYLYIQTAGSNNITEKAVIFLVHKCTKLTQLFLYIKTQMTDSLVVAVAANLVSLTDLGIETLQLHNPRMLRCLKQ